MVPATRLIVTALILLMVEARHTPHMAEGDHTPHMTGVDHTHTPHMVSVDHTFLTTAAGIVQGLHTSTEGGHRPMTDQFHHTTAGADTDLFPVHLVLLHPEGGAIPAVYPHREATLAAIPQDRRGQQATLLREGVQRSPHIVDLLARGVVQGKATLTAAVRTPGLCLGSAQLDLRSVSS